MERTLKINYWYRKESKVPDLEEYAKQLEDAAIARIFEMHSEGYAQGELCELIAVDGDELEVRGWWSITTEGE